jgi:hypothetical protein
MLRGERTRDELGVIWMRCKAKKHELVDEIIDALVNGARLKRNAGEAQNQKAGALEV